MSTHGIMGTLSKHQKPSFWHGLKPPHYKPSKNPVQNPASSGQFFGKPTTADIRGSAVYRQNGLTAALYCGCEHCWVQFYTPRAAVGTKCEFATASRMAASGFLALSKTVVFGRVTSDQYQSAKSSRVRAQ